MPPLGKLLILAGVVLVIAGAAVTLAGRLGILLGRLPGDIHVGGFSFPIVTCLILSLVLTLVMWLLRR